DATGIFGVTPAAASPNAADASAGLSALAGRLRADTRVRWVEPISGVTAAAANTRGPPQP
ncbi:MAG TPA: hypothetical protein VGG67_00190, partial [Steroidobacteraceae bacterium]